ncbi:MAG: S-layer homology domain-containing protein [Eubacteriales bacterium]|jgi:hypothetical protein
MKRILPLFLCICLTCALFAGVNATKAASASYVMFMNPGNATKYKGLLDGESWKKSGKTIAKLSGGVLTLSGVSGYSILSYGGDLTIVLSGTNTLESSVNNVLCVPDGSLTIKGSGSLTLTATGDYSGIYTSGKLTVSDGIIRANAKANAILAENTITFDGGKVTARSDSVAISSRAGNVAVNSQLAAVGSYKAVSASGSIKIGGKAYTKAYTGLFTYKGEIYASFTGEQSIKALSGRRSYKEGQFSDVKPSDWYKTAVKQAYETGLVGGSSGAFHPEGSVTVAEALTMAARLHNIYNGGDGAFTQFDTWYEGYVFYCLAVGIFKLGEFSNYDKTITRSQMAYVFANTLPESELQPINTVDSLPDVGEKTMNRNAIFKLYRAGVLTGSDSSGTFGPSETITRAAAAAIIARMAIPSERKILKLK